MIDEMETRRESPVPTGGPEGEADGGSLTVAALGLYVHVPFCAVTCDFCAFYQKTPEKGDFRRYVEGVRRELDLVAPDRPVDTVFWGGGTPGLLPPEFIRELGAAIRQYTGGAPAEWSVELTPESVRDAKLEAFREIGVTRISLGVQSFQARLLEAMGRRSSREAILAGYARLREHGFDNVNLDLIFAFPGQTLEEWESDLREAADLGPDHLSTYCLTFEEDTALWAKLANGEFSLDEDKEAEFFRVAEEVLEPRGLLKYETSNYARPGRECRHNLNTWRMAEWVGLGPAAASQFRGRRYANPAGLEDWLQDLGRGRRGACDRVELSPSVLAADTLVFGLRLRGGVDLPAVEDRFPGTLPDSLREFFEGLCGEGLAEMRADRRLFLTPRGRLLADRIGTEILERFE